MLQWKIDRLQLELKYSWKISRNSSDYKTNFIITAADEFHSAMGEVAPNIRYGETPEIIEEQFKKFLLAGVAEIGNVNVLQELMQALGLCNSLRFGIESAFIHYLSLKAKITTCQYLNRKETGALQTSFSLPIMDPGNIAAFIKENRLARFKYLKVKTDKEAAYDIIKEVARNTDRPLMIDGNECWADVEELLRFMERLRPFKLVFLEQPMPAGLTEEYFYLKKQTPYELIADESVTDMADFDILSKQFHGINMKLMKAGGYLNGIRLLEETKKRNMKTMVGCMVETSLGISSAMHVCSNVDYIDLDGFLIIKNDPFGFVKEEDGVLRLVRK
jgi:L-Ala-D/L-Glu epimerase